VKGLLSRFFSTVSGQTLIALSFNTISILAGSLIAIFTPLFDVSPWILALFPPVLTIRGCVGGIFSGNLATMLHLGLVKPQLRDNTENYYALIKSVLVITTLDTLVLGVVSFTLNFMSGNIGFELFPVFVGVPTVACMAAVCFSVPITSVIAIETYRRGLDPDILVYPILASVNDIVVTVFYVLTVSMILLGGAYTWALYALFALVSAAMVVLGLRSMSNLFFRQTLREGAFIVVMSSVFGSVNGVLLSRLGGSIREIPGLIIMYPALTNSLGNIGSIIGSKMTTDMALGYARGFLEELRDAGRRILQVEAPAAVIHVVFAVISFLIVGPGAEGVSFPRLLSVALCTNLISFGVISLFAITSAYMAFERGLNPDNVVIPTITSVSDTAATLAVNPAVALTRLLVL
jgi:mgtE-like transporter